METSRLFVRGLPPKLAEEEFRKYFSHTAPVTDAKLIPHRRIGYVGYKTPEAAAKALKHHNRTFIRASKIQVEYAKSIAELRPDARRSGIDGGEGTKRDDGREDENVAQRTGGAKLDEFLETMHPDSKRTWTNGDARSQPAETQAQRTTIPDDAQESEGDYEPLPKRSKTEAAVKARSMANTAAETTLTPSREDPTDIPSEPATGIAASDADWLKTRTSRLLGLHDDLDSNSDEADEPQPIKGGPPKLESESRNHVPAQEASDAGSQTDDDLHEPSSKQQVATDPMEWHDKQRVFVRNLPYEADEAGLRDYFSRFGSIEQVHVPRNGRTGLSKGFAYVQFTEDAHATKAISGANAESYQGRLLHVMPAIAKRDEGLDEFAISKLSHKKQQHIRRKAEAASAEFRWNTLFMNPDAVMASTAEKLGVTKSELLDPTSSSAAVKQAHAETNIIQETKNFLQANGVDLESFKGRERSPNVILVKNFTYGTTQEELKQLFGGYGSVMRLLMPPAGTMAIVELEQADQTKQAFSALAYRKLGESVLFLEKAPKNVFGGKVQVANTKEKELGMAQTEAHPSTSDLMEVDGAESTASATLFVRNLNFDTSSAKLHDLFLPLKGFLSARVKTKANPKRPGQLLSMGFGFVEFQSREDAQGALAAMDGYSLDGHRLQIKSSHKGLDAAEERRREDVARKAAGRHTKIIIKNLPFETTRQDVRALFSPYGKLRSIRVPKKFDRSTRGFAFADFVTVKEAQNAMEALAGTHLLGRRLNLEFAAEEAIDPEKEIEEMSKKVGRQLEKVTARQLTTSSRKKFSVHQNEDDDVSFD